MTRRPRENNEMTNNTRKPNSVQKVYSKPCLLKTNPAILREFYKLRLVEPKTIREYCFLCTACCCFVPLNRDGHTCITKHRRLLLKVYENELESVKLPSESDRSRVLRKSSLNGFGLENKTIERPFSSSAVKKLSSVETQGINGMHLSQMI